MISLHNIEDMGPFLLAFNVAVEMSDAMLIPDPLNGTCLCFLETWENLLFFSSVLKFHRQVPGVSLFSSILPGLLGAFSLAAHVLWFQNYFVHFLLSIFCDLLFLKKSSFIYFEREREKESACTGEGQREGEGQNPKQNPASQIPMWGSNSEP